MTIAEIDLKALAAPFPGDVVSWRAQSVTKDGGKALALAYIDARDVMNRLDEVVGIGNWQSAISETPKGRVLCTLSIRVADAWICKTDGAGDTDVEGEKGAISDALKRAAVLWGIGRYLYDLESPWVPCESREFNGKKQWVKWKESPWNHVKQVRPSAAPRAAATMPEPQPTRYSPAFVELENDQHGYPDLVDYSERFRKALEDVGSVAEYSAFYTANAETLANVKALSEMIYDEIRAACSRVGGALKSQEREGQ